MLNLLQILNGFSRLSNLVKRGGIQFATLLCFVLTMAMAFETGAVLISTGDGTGNTTPPPADPGFNNVGVVFVFSGVYVGNGWVLTANHVGENPITLLGVTYNPVPGSSVRFQNPDSSLADLIAFKLLGPNPPLPALTITNSAPTPNTLLTLVGKGRNRGTPITWQGTDGWNWASGTALRWGTNEIFETGLLVLGTQSFSTRSDVLPPDQASTQHEADIVSGDSGGAAFTGSDATAKLVGILFARATYTGQPTETSLFGTNVGNSVGNIGFIVDLFAYRNDILALIDQPDCSDGLDDDGDGLIDFPSDPGCSDALDTNERGPSFKCDNGIDDDKDQLIDFPDDDGCVGPTDQSEAPLFVPNTSFGAAGLGLALYALARRALRRRSLLVE